MFRIILALVAFTLIGCQSPVAPDKPGKVVKNSVWATVTPSLSRAIDGADLVAYVEEYNATNFDDYLRIYDSDEVPALEDAPDVDVFICNPATYEVNVSHVGVTRASLVENASLWRADAYGQLIFIDHVPPPPVVVPPVSLYAWYSMYLIDETGHKVYEDHCGYLPDDTWDGQWILDGGWRNADHYFETTSRAYRGTLVDHPGWTYVEHALYTEPVL